ncbi:MAG: ribosome maturation factor RimM [Hyphomicrobiaceae bacterium]
MAVERVLLGRITKPHGVRGEVLVLSFCAEPEHIASYGPLTDNTGTRTFELVVRGSTAKGLIARIAGVDDRNAAEMLRGVELYLERTSLPAPEPDEVYLADLVGMAVVNTDGAELGTVVAVANFGGGDLIEVLSPGKQHRTEFLPLARPFLVEIDESARIVRLEIASADDAETPD